MKKSTIIGLILIGGAIGFYFFSYWNKGGFNPTSIEIRSETNIELNGLEYNGVVKNPKFGSCFDEVEDAIVLKRADGHVCAYYYSSPGKENNSTIKVFVGAKLEEKGLSLKDSFETRAFRIGETLHGEQESNLMVASIYDDLREYATENNIRLDSNVVFEQYISDKKMVLDIPILK